MMGLRLRGTTQRKARASLLGAASALAMIGAEPVLGQTVAATPAATGQDVAAAGGQADAAGSGQEIVVRGIRAANESAIRIKRNADTIVDAITAEDIGALPDKSITESLQRIPGVSINRFAAINDPDHVSEEGQSPVIRGLPYVNSQFNGRDAFTANRGRALNFQDIPADLAASVEVYKNQTADQIEGGIAGIINIVTRRPLDTNHDYAAFNANVNYGDLRKSATPEVSAILSHQFDSNIGRFGILGSASFSKIDERVENARVTTYRDYRTADPTRGIVASSFGGLTGASPGVDYYVPLGGGYSVQDNDRKRIGASAALQWESPDRNLLATFQYIHAETTTLYTERTLSPGEDGGDTQQFDVIGGVQAATFDRNNVFLKGTVGGPAGVEMQDISRGEKQFASTNDFSGHLTWKAGSRLKFDFDGQYVKSDSHNLDASVVSFAAANNTISNLNGFPITTYSRPASFLTSGYGLVPLASVTSSGSVLADPATTFWRSAQDHQDNTKGQEYAFRADGEFDFADDGFLRRVKFGARYADRKQTIRADGYNWGNLSERWNGGIVTAQQLTPSGFGVVDVGSLFRGATPDFNIIGFQGNPASGYNQLIAGASQIQQVLNSFCTFQSLATGVRSCGGLPTAASRASIATGGAGDGYHTLGEISSNDEQTWGGYARLDFSTRDLGWSHGLVIDGNVGLRYVHTQSDSVGYYSIPSASSVFNIPGGASTIDCSTYAPPLATGKYGYNICLNSADQRAAILKFLGAGAATGGAAYVPNTTSQSYDDFLPSVNIRIAPSDKAQFRFAYSKAISRPSFNDLRNYVQFQVPGPVGTLTANQPFPAVALKANSYGNPLLQPIKSDNFDLTAEFYYSRSGSITVGGFYKHLTNIYSVLNGIASNNGGVANNVGVDLANPSVIQFTNNGQTLPANVSVTNNGPSASLKGIELDVRQNSFGFLDPVLDGLGATFNFTYIDADKLGQQPVLPANYDTTTPGYNAATGFLTSFPFPGISKYNLNAEVFYEKYGVQARVAYTWRSSYFVSSQDSLGPNDPTYTGASGFLDASLFYAITKNIKVGVTGSNLANTRITTYNVINRAGLQALRGVNEADRRFTAGIRVGF